ncbi:EFM5 [Candida oxycetoniae]|uniref:EFM5 n=1 Tax=Candida oxycetoniae TaxID=497107 RepID=A0AAI9WVT1_9ASCO|nr:EFM5 [Candida oxycetoniae]KAI3402541.1 EFM5 [Candida oxycetoniae]
MLRTQVRLLPRLNSIRYRTVYTSVLESDINITPAGKVNISVGPGGRSSRTGYTATVFGASGFLGRYLVSKLARHGTTTIVPYRDDLKKRFLKVAGDLGVVNFVEIDARNLQSIEDSVAHSDIVINCIGADYNTKNFSMADVNIALAERIARASKDAGVPRFIHISSYNANPNSESVFYATKGIGEQKVKEIYPDATIVRPAQMFGREDNLLNYLGPKIKMWTPNRNQKEIYPVYVLDVARALEKIAYDDSTMGKTFELYGPEKLTYQEIRQMIHGITENYAQAGPFNYSFYDYNLPLPLAKFITQFEQYVWWKLPNPDQMQRHVIDQKIDPTASTFKDLGIAGDGNDGTTKLADVLFSYVKQWRHPLIAQKGGPNKKKLEDLRNIQHFTD